MDHQTDGFWNGKSFKSKTEWFFFLAMIKAKCAVIQVNWMEHTTNKVTKVNIIRIWFGIRRRHTNVGFIYLHGAHIHFSLWILSSGVENSSFGPRFHFFLHYFSLYIFFTLNSMIILAPPFKPSTSWNDLFFYFEGWMNAIFFWFQFISQPNVKNFLH